MEELKGKLRGLVEISKEVMNNNVEGLKWVNGKIIIQKAQPLNSVLLSATKPSKKLGDKHTRYRYVDFY